MPNLWSELRSSPVSSISEPLAECASQVKSSKTFKKRTLWIAFFVALFARIFPHFDLGRYLMKSLYPAAPHSLHIGLDRVVKSPEEASLLARSRTHLHTTVIWRQRLIGARILNRVGRRREFLKPEVPITVWVFLICTCSSR